MPTDRCPRVNYTSGVFSCSCCGTPLFYATTKYDAQTGWPAFHSPAYTENATNVSTVCTPGGTEVVCSKCGAHLGDYFADDDHYCIDGVCLLPPGSKDACPVGSPGRAPSEQDAWRALRSMLREKGSASLQAALDHHADGHHGSR